MPLSYRVTEHGEMCDLGKHASERHQQQNLLLHDLNHNWNYQSKGGLNAKQYDRAICSNTVVWGISV